VKCNEREERLIPLADIPLFCRLTPARVGVEVVSGGARLDVPARAEAERRVPDLRVVLTALLLLVDIVAGALAVVRLIMLLIVAMLKEKTMRHESSTKKNVNTCRARTNTAKFCLLPPHIDTLRERSRTLRGSDNCSNQRNWYIEKRP